MKLFAILSLAAFSFSAFSQTCYVDMVDRYNRAIRTYTGYGDQSICYEAMKECRKAIRLEPHLGGVDCIKASSNPNPNPNPGNGIPDVVIRMGEIEQATNFALRNCYVVPNAGGWANQLYVNNSFRGNYQDGTQDAQLRRVIRDLQYQGQCLLKNSATLRLQFDPSFLRNAISNSLSRNCYVIENAGGWANQLMINGSFSGNFDSRSQHETLKLKSTLADFIESGRCVQRSYEEIRILNDPYLLNDFAQYKYRGCHVVLNASGRYNQLYVNNSFRGNFDQYSEVPKLKGLLVDLIMNGTCRYDAI